MWKKKPNPSAVLLFGITLALFFSPTVPSASNPWSWIAWFALVVVSERLWHHTIDNRGLFTMGPVIAVPTLALVPPPVGPVIVISGALLATMLFRRTMRTAWVYLGMVAVSSCVLVLLLQFALGWSWSPTESLGVKEVVFMAGAALLYLG
ncbi:MAG: hypothetical protein HKN21_01975, partial [Candidatus Eisenbacteria bacterium]|nr:hypothetical protein [Candidatus Eisenbacteria bacterium]